MSMHYQLHTTIIPSMHVSKGKLLYGEYSQIIMDRNTTYIFQMKTTLFSFQFIIFIEFLHLAKNKSNYSHMEANNNIMIL
jgi:hypothetical protein